MPFIDVKTSAELNSEKIEQIKSDLGKAIALIPGKSENWLMVNITGRDTVRQGICEI